MPHFHLEYLANLETLVDMAGLCKTLRKAGERIEIFPLAGIRVRTIKVDHYEIADGDEKHGFIDLTIRLREGRSSAVKQKAVEEIFVSMRTFMESVLAHASVALSAEIRDIQADMAPKYSTIRHNL